MKDIRRIGAVLSGLTLIGLGGCLSLDLSSITEQVGPLVVGQLLAFLNGLAM